MRFSRLLAFSLLSALAACGGGGGGSGTPPAQQGLTVLIDTAAGPGADLNAIVVGMALERPDGSLTGNLIPAAGSELRFADPQGLASGMRLDAVPEGDYVALHVAFLPESGRRRRDDGSLETIAFERQEHRFAFEDRLAHRRGSDDWLYVRHERELQLVTGAGGARSWRPAFAGRRGTLLGVHEGRFEVLRVHAATATIEGRLWAFGRALPFTIQVEPLTEYRRKLGATKERLSKEAFFAAVQPGAFLEVEGRIEGNAIVARELEVRAGSLSGPSHHVYGRVVAVDPPNQTVSVQVLSVREGAQSLPGGAFPVLVVDAAGAEIGRSRTGERLGFAALVVGAFVEVEWEGAWTSGPVRAREIHLEDSLSGGGAHPEIEGQVGSVDVPGGKLVMVPRRDNPLIVAGRIVTSAEVRVNSGTLVYRDESGAQRVTIPLDQVRAGERAWVVGTVDASGIVTARWVRVRSQ